MCLKKVYYNTYADGTQDVTEKMYACREGRVAHLPEVRIYDRKLAFNKRDPGAEPPRSPVGLRPISYFTNELPTPRRSKSPTPTGRRDSGSYVSSAKLADLLKPRKRHDRFDPPRRSPRHADSDHEHSEPSRLKRASTTPHFVVIEQGAPVFRGVPASDLLPLHVPGEHSSRRRSTRDREYEAGGHHLRRRNSANLQGYVVPDDERERRRQDRELKRRLSTSAKPEAPDAPVPPVLAPVLTAEPRRYSLRRSATVAYPSGGSNSSGSSPPKSKRLRWEDEVRLAREQQNAEIANRPPPEVHQEPPLKGILKTATGERKVKREESDTHELRRGVERIDIPETRGKENETKEELDLWNKDRLRARFGPEGSGTRGGKRRQSKVWVDDDRYQYF